MARARIGLTGRCVVNSGDRGLLAPGLRLLEGGSMLIIALSRDFHRVRMSKIVSRGQRCQQLEVLVKLRRTMLNVGLSITRHSS